VQESTSSNCRAAPVPAAGSGGGSLRPSGYGRIGGFGFEIDLIEKLVDQIVFGSGVVAARVRNQLGRISKRICQRPSVEVDVEIEITLLAQPNG
jgi:hypothetical protein